MLHPDATGAKRRERAQCFQGPRTPAGTDRIIAVDVAGSSVHNIWWAGRVIPAGDGKVRAGHSRRGPQRRDEQEKK